MSIQRKKSQCNDATILSPCPARESQLDRKMTDYRACDSKMPSINNQQASLANISHLKNPSRISILIPINKVTSVCERKKKSSMTIRYLHISYTKTLPMHFASFDLSIHVLFARSEIRKW